MGTKRLSNEGIHIGDIYMQTFRDECESSCAFYQVVGLRAKTMVELRPIRSAYFLDESCNLALCQVMARPLPGQFHEKLETFTVRTGGVSDIDGRIWLHQPGEDGFFSEMREGEAWQISGYAGSHAMDRMEKEGTLPEWAKEQRKRRKSGS